MAKKVLRTLQDVRQALLQHCPPGMTLISSEEYQDTRDHNGWHQHTRYSATLIPRDGRSFTAHGPTPFDLYRNFSLKLAEFLEPLRIKHTPAVVVPDARGKLTGEKQKRIGCSG